VQKCKRRKKLKFLVCKNKQEQEEIQPSKIEVVWIHLSGRTTQEEGERERERERDLLTTAKPKG
jgi:primosomal replication protein N